MKVIIELDTFDRTIRRMAHEILEHHPKFQDVVLVGILGKGYRLAGIIQQIIKEIAEVDLPTYGLEIRPFRDDPPQKNNWDTSRQIPQ